MKKRALFMILPIVTLILELVPYGAVCNFANPDGDAWRRTFSYFDLTPFGYANFAPFLTAVVTCAVCLVLLIYLFAGKSVVLTVAKVFVILGVVLSLCPLIYGIVYFSVVGGMITVALTAELVLLFALGKSS